MRLETSQVGNVSILRLTGDFDYLGLGEVTPAIEALLERDAPRVVLDLKGVTFINSRALSYLWWTRKRAQQADGELVLAAPSPFVREVMMTLGLGKVLTILDTEDEAVAHLQ